MKLIEIFTDKPYVNVKNVKDEKEAEYIAGSNSQWILLTDDQFKIFKKNFKKQIA
jgi:hypothetical protein